jgi:hypothetical protein
MDIPIYWYTIENWYLSNVESIPFTKLVLLTGVDTACEKILLHVHPPIERAILSFLPESNNFFKSPKY